MTENNHLLFSWNRWVRNLERTQCGRCIFASQCLGLGGLESWKLKSSECSFPHVSEGWYGSVPLNVGFSIWCLCMEVWAHPQNGGGFLQSNYTPKEREPGVCCVFFYDLALEVTLFPLCTICQSSYKSTQIQREGT